MIKFFRDGSWKPTLTQMYNVQCWYNDTACEVFQIRAYSKDDAIERAMRLAKQKGYDKVKKYLTYSDFAI